jgi:hypothetical protein
MTEYEREYNYVKTYLRSMLTPNDLSSGKQLKHSFFNKYSMLVSPTDKTWLKIMDELNSIEQEKIKQITSSYLFGQN